MTAADHSVDLKALQIRPLENKDCLKGFLCGERSIDTFVAGNAFKHHTANRVKIFCAHQPDSQTAIAVYSLAMRLEDARKLKQDEIGHYGNDGHFPAIYIATLAVRSHYQSQKIGTLLLMNALQRAYYIGQNVAVFGVALRSLSPRTTSMYEKFGFGKRDNDGNPLMVLPIWSLNELIGARG